MKFRLVIVDTKNKSDRDLELLTDDVKTKGECEKAGEEFCYMHPDQKPKPAKEVSMK
jgi:hypothetical protein